MNPTLAAAVRSIIPGPNPRPTDPTDANPTAGVDDAGAGETPIEPPLEGRSPAPVPPALGALPAFSPDLPQNLHGAPKVKRSGPGAKVAALTSYTIANAAQPSRIVPGSNERRRVRIWLDSDPGAGRVWLAPDARTDTSGLPLPTSTSSVRVIELHSGDDFYVYWPLETVPGASPRVCVQVEPLLSSCDCA